MSKNFELMQRAGKICEIEVPVRPSLRPEPLPPPRRNNSGSQPSPKSFKIDEMAREETLRLVQQIFLLQTQEPPRAVVFAGIEHGNGCSRICADVAEILQANVQGSVCLVEANFRSPALPRMFGTTNHYGLTDALLSEEPIRSFARTVRSPDLWLISSGALAADSHGLLNSDRLRKRFEELRSAFDYILVDAPPLTRYSDAMALGKLADGFVLVVEANSTKREAAVTASEALHAAQIRVLGAVLNKRTFPIPGPLYRSL